MRSCVHSGHAFVKTIFISIIFSAILNIALADNGVIDFRFPSPSMHSQSATGEFVASYEDPGVNVDGLHEFRFSILDKNQQELTGFTFLRSVDGAWYDSSNLLFVNNYIGSNVTDCLVLKVLGTQVRLVSLTDVLLHLKESGPMVDPKIKPPENPLNSHYYLKCDRWIDNHTVKVSLVGTTDAGGDFHYEFQFDKDNDRFSVAR